MKKINALLLLSVSAALLGPAVMADDGKVIFEDDFERCEKDDKLEQVGNGWGTNSKSRAKGVKQVDLVDGTMHITRAEVADHGVSVVQDLKFQDAVIEMKFKIGEKDDLGVNIADMKEKSVHAGHICVARIRPFQVELTDLKTGRMDLATRQRRQNDELTESDQKRIKATTKKFKAKVAKDEWHQLKMQIRGKKMVVAIDGTQVGEFESEGIGHATKSRIRLSVNKSAWVDNVKVTRLK